MKAPPNLSLSFFFTFAACVSSTDFAGAQAQSVSNEIATISQVGDASHGVPSLEDEPVGISGSAMAAGLTVDTVDVRVVQQGHYNQANIGQGSLTGLCGDCLLDAMQLGDFNVSSIMQDGIGNAAVVVQDGTFNEIAGWQRGSDNALSIEQLNSGNFAAVRQFGDGRRVSISQPGEGFIDVTQD